MLCTLLVTTCEPRRQVGQQLDAEFDVYVQEVLDDWGAPGVMIVVVEGDEAVYMKGHGSRVLGEDRPIDEATIIQIASHTKPITATAIAMLVDEGRLSWDDPVKMHIPEFELPDSYVAEHATIRDILSHQVGLPRGVPVEEPSFPALAAALSTQPLVAGFREHFVYSSAGYVIAGEIVSRVSGRSWEQFIKQRLFKPLAMRSSYTSTLDLITHLGPPTADKNVFMPVEQDGDSVFLGDWNNLSDGGLYAPAGGILTTASDIAKWMVFQLQNGQFGGERLVSEEGIWETRKPEVLLQQSMPSPITPVASIAAYGLGWVSFEFQGRTVYEHPGGLMSSFIALMPEENLAVGAFTNANFNYGGGSIGLVSALTMEVFERLLGAPDEDWSKLYLDRR
jgi:CubicO group peptidase (beta-lactamase class C family)